MEAPRLNVFMLAITQMADAKTELVRVHCTFMALKHRNTMNAIETEENRLGGEENLFEAYVFYLNPTTSPCGATKHGTELALTLRNSR